MQLNIKHKEQKEQFLQKIKERVEQNSLCCQKYIDLGVKVVRVLCYAPDFLPLMQKQLTYTLKDYADKYDSTLVIWKETDVVSLAMSLGNEFDPKKNMRLRLDMLYSKGKYPQVEILDEAYSSCVPIMYFNGEHGVVEAMDTDNQIYYYGVSNLEPEEFIKQGHIFVQQLNNIIKTPTVNLVHGAVVGMNNNGVLFCARGQRGKSTLTVLSMMKGFEYVSDDYLILEEKDEKLYSSPIYSIITLSPKMYNELYDELKGKFVSNNARKDKYVINIADYHNQFRVNYPIKLCIFPEIVTDKEPSIYACSSADKGRAIVQLIQSTVSQMRDLNNKQVIRKLLNMVKDLDFYKFNLCHDIQKNTAFLRDFLQNFSAKKLENQKIDKVMVDITFDLANILDTETCTIYSMNKFSTNIYENLLNGVKKEEISAALQNVFDEQAGLSEAFDKFVKTLFDKGFIINTEGSWKEPKINLDFAKEDKYRLSIWEYTGTKAQELIK